MAREPSEEPIHDKVFFHKPCAAAEEFKQPVLGLAGFQIVPAA
jgi:hypothetical protein